MKNIIFVALFILLSFIVGELSFLVYLNQVSTKPKITYIKSPIAYTYDEMKNSDYFITAVNKAKENGIGLNKLASYFNGANMLKKPMVQSYIISVTAKGRVEKIETSPDRIAITLQDEKNVTDKVVFVYHSDVFSKIEFLPKTLKLTDLKEGDVLTITDSVDMRTSKTIKSIIEK